MRLFLDYWNRRKRETFTSSCKMPSLARKVDYTSGSSVVMASQPSESVPFHFFSQIQHFFETFNHLVLMLSSFKLFLVSQWNVSHHRLKQRILQEDSTFTVTVPMVLQRFDDSNLPCLALRIDLQTSRFANLRSFVSQLLASTLII